MMKQRPAPEEVMDFWFAGDPSLARPVWFEKSTGFDAACARFAAARDQAKAGGLDHWIATPHGALALVILLDQFSRNLHRGSAEAFAADRKALAIARAAVAQGYDRTLAPLERVFLYLPFEHAEDLETQDEAVRLFEALRGQVDEKTIEFAHRHRDVIRRFGRFPHRNAVLGRTGTAAEGAYLAQPGSGF